MLHKILFVCTGNICRSPTAEGVARGGGETECGHFEFDSAHHGYHVGDRRIRVPSPQRRAATT